SYSKDDDGWDNDNTWPHDVKYSSAKRPDKQHGDGINDKEETGCLDQSKRLRINGNERQDAGIRKRDENADGRNRHRFFLQKIVDCQFVLFLFNKRSFVYLNS